MLLTYYLWFVYGALLIAAMSVIAHYKSSIKPAILIGIGVLAHFMAMEGFHYAVQHTELLKNAYSSSNEAIAAHNRMLLSGAAIATLCLFVSLFLKNKTDEKLLKKSFYQDLNVVSGTVQSSDIDTETHWKENTTAIGNGYTAVASTSGKSWNVTKSLIEIVNKAGMLKRHMLPYAANIHRGEEVALLVNKKGTILGSGGSRSGYGHVDGNNQLFRAKPISFHRSEHVKYLIVGALLSLFMAILMAIPYLQILIMLLCLIEVRSLAANEHVSAGKGLGNILILCYLYLSYCMYADLGVIDASYVLYGGFSWWMWSLLVSIPLYGIMVRNLISKQKIGQYLDVLADRSELHTLKDTAS